MPPRTHQTKKGTSVLLPVNATPLPKSTPHAPEGASASVVADQLMENDWTLVKGWPLGIVGPGDGTDGSTRLASSCTEGSRQPVRPPVVRPVHWNRALLQAVAVVDGDCSHTSPVSLSRTAKPLMTHVNRLELLGHAPPGSFAGKVLSQACGSPLWSAPVERLSIFRDKALCCVV